MCQRAYQREGTVASSDVTCALCTIEIHTADNAKAYSVSKWMDQEELGKGSVGPAANAKLGMWLGHKVAWVAC